MSQFEQKLKEKTRELDQNKSRMDVLRFFFAFSPSFYSINQCNVSQEVDEARKQLFEEKKNSLQEKNRFEREVSLSTKIILFLI